MKIQHPRRNYSGVEIHQARRLEFVDGVAETGDDKALAAALGAKGYCRIIDIEPNPVPYEDSVVAPKPVTSKRKRSKPADEASIEDDIPHVTNIEPTIDD